MKGDATMSETPEERAEVICNNFCGLVVTRQGGVAKAIAAAIRDAIRECEPYMNHLETCPVLGVYGPIGPCNCGRVKLVVVEGRE